ncbi:MAG TPA: hypothetical protein VNT79_15510, partial [Phycisphaerae bacterium]|nr:hypothetical protein [Phycisphaerae bacterium]
MSHRSRILWFTLLAPITVPAYLLFLAVSNLLGGAYYIVVEATLSRIVGRPINLSKTEMLVWAIPVLILAPAAAAGQFLVAVFRGIGRMLCAIGHWQTGLLSRGAAFTFGLTWVAAAVWTTMVCLNAAMAMGWIGQGVSVETKNKFVDVYRRELFLDELPADMQARRRQVIADLESHKQSLSPHWDSILDSLKNDGFPFRAFRRAKVVMKKIAGVPWYYEPEEFSDDGLEHSDLLLGALIFCWMLLIRWPGTFAVLRTKPLYVGWFLLRTSGVVAVMYMLARWAPLTL